MCFPSCRGAGQAREQFLSFLSHVRGELQVVGKLRLAVTRTRVGLCYYGSSSEVVFGNRKKGRH